MVYVSPDIVKTVTPSMGNKIVSSFIYASVVYADQTSTPGFIVLLWAFYATDTKEIQCKIFKDVLRSHKTLFFLLEQKLF